MSFLIPVRTRPLLSPILAALLALAAGGCGGNPPVPDGEATQPTHAVALLNQHLRDNDLTAFARDAVPPALHPPLAAAWRAGKTRWPLDELPFDQNIPGMLAILSADKAEANLRRDFTRQFANANSEIKAAASALGQFGVKYLQSDTALSAEERAHYVQWVSALSEWGGKAKLGDPKRARGTITRLTLAARRTGLREASDFQRLGMQESLRQLEPMVAAVKDSLRDYGLDLDQSLDDMVLSLHSQDGDRARVRMRYTLAGRNIDAIVAVERIDGHWYLSDFLRHARAAAALAPAPEAMLPTLTLPEIAPPLVAPPGTTPQGSTGPAGTPPAASPSGTPTSPPASS